MSRFFVLIPSAGVGSRMQQSLPKQYVPLMGKPLIRYAVDCFETLSDICSIVVITAGDHAIYLQDILSGCTKTSVIACGGDTRAQTVLNGLLQLMKIANDDDWVLVHDAARPGVSHDVVHRLLNIATPDSDGGILALPVADTLKRSNVDGKIIDTVSREDLWMAQTPQMFRIGALYQALRESVSRQPTDEAQAMAWAGFQVLLVHGDLCNLKVTYPQDLQTVAALMQATHQ